MRPWLIKAAHDVSGEARDDKGEWTTGGSPGGKGKPKGKPAAKPKATAGSHADTYKDIQAQIAALKEKAKELRQTAHSEARDKASASLAASHAINDESMVKDGINQIGWDVYAHDVITRIEEAIQAYDPDWTHAERVEHFREVLEMAAEAKDLDWAEWKDEDGEGLPADQIADNKKAVAHIEAKAKEALRHLKAHAAARKEAQSIKSGDWLEKCLAGLMVAKGLARPWLFKGFQRDQKRGDSENAGHFGSGGGKKEPDSRPNANLDAFMAMGDEAKPAPARLAAQPPPLPAGKPHERTQTAALSAANAVVAAARSGNPKATAAAHGKALQALKAHYAEGAKAIAAMRLSPGRAATLKSKFRAKILAAKAKLDGIAGLATPGGERGTPPPIPRVLSGERPAPRRKDARPWRIQGVDDLPVFDLAVPTPEARPWVMKEVTR